MSDVDVLVVGAGPSGLTLAAMLSRAGVRYRIVEKSPAPSDKSRALVVHAKTMEILQKLGVVDDLLARGRKAMDVALYIDRVVAFEAEIGEMGADDTPYSFALFVSQVETERVLLRALTDAGGNVERGVEAKSFETDANGVTATLVHSKTEGNPAPGANNREEKIRARYIVGCDGAHSAVRHAGDFKFDGEPYQQDFAIADVNVDLGEKTAFRLFFNDDGLIALFPLYEENLYRVLSTRADPPSADAGDPTLEEMQKLFERFTPFKAKLEHPRWLARFRLHHRQADRYRDNRFFLVGDAAHIHSPAGGQGMNTGIQDATNLAWKLALVIKSNAHEKLLDTYDEERHPIGAQLLRTTDRMFSVNTTGNRAVMAIRNFVVRRIAARIVKTRVRGKAFRHLAELQIAYPQSSIVIEKGSGLASTLHAGQRAPDAPFDVSTIFEATKSLSHHLLVFAGHDKEAAATFASVSDRNHRWLESHFIAPSNEIARERYGIKEAGLVLLRPDGYVALRAAALGDEMLEAYRRRIFG
jgi:2-polyprenyl-6-methoxyphenol hydroxylase-like FAD-dependent oxidoreductase